ncbi:MAG: 1,4-alpha-glucan branching protein GlgB [Myxococcales bacterium]|nr:1,4-alpha-glucan branching protein GlgB [Myxococcales bacterium]
MSKQNPPLLIDDRSLALFLALEHHDPHAILGAHPTPAGVVVRVFQPHARSVTVLAEGARLPLEKVHDNGLFAGLFPDAQQVFPYKLRFDYHDGESHEQVDPYSFLPTLGDLDLHLIGEGRHEKLYEKMGAHVMRMGSVEGTSFTVWAPNARGVSVVGDFNGWDGRVNPMRMLGGSGIWELFLPGVGAGARYKFELRKAHGGIVLKADPYAQAAEHPPQTASVVVKSSYSFNDDAWLQQRKASNPWRSPFSVYEMHLGSWKRVPEDGNRSMTYRELAPEVADYLGRMGFTHVELLPVFEHPFDGSWGYQVSGYFAPTSRFGSPDDFKYFVDYLHDKGFGVLVDWVPAHFPKDEFALGRFDGTALYEHLDSRQGEHPDWGTFVFNFGRREVRNFLIASALSWFDRFHIDGLRVDAVASMLYLDYSRKEGEWVPNQYGGRENLEAVTFLRELNEVVHRDYPGVLMIAEESTAWPGVSRPNYLGGLGFGFKWNMGWMHDTLQYFSKDPVYRRYHHNDLTFGLVYAWSENFILPFSHDEVVHGKGSMLDKMPGDRWQKFANLRALYAYMWAHPGKKLLFMGQEIGQWQEWKHTQSLDWNVLMGEDHQGLQWLVADLNRVYKSEPALHEVDESPEGFEWIDSHSADDNVIAFLRKSPATGRSVICVGNFAPVPRHGYRMGVPRAGQYRELLNTDAAVWGGSNVGNDGAVASENVPHHGRPFSLNLTLPPLGVLWLEVPSA